MRTRNYVSETDPYYNSKTAKQWQAENRAINAGAQGELMWANGFKQDRICYYIIEDTHPATPEEMEIWQQERQERRERKREKARIAAEKAQKEREQEEQRRAKERERLQKFRAFDPDKIICLDVETTGLNPYADEILQLSIIDGSGEVLFNEYIKPKRATEWEEAQAIHGITPEMVKDNPTIDAYIDKLNDIFEAAELIVGYNIEAFDLYFIGEAGIDVPDEAQTFDVMLEFAPIYGEWNSYRKDYKWQKLAVCADYYNYPGSGNYHDSLEDVRATLHCFYAMT